MNAYERLLKQWVAAGARMQQKRKLRIPRNWLRID